MIYMKKMMDWKSEILAKEGYQDNFSSSLVGAGKVVSIQKEVVAEVLLIRTH